jgi:NAD+ kinase
LANCHWLTAIGYIGYFTYLCAWLSSPPKHMQIALFSKVAHEKDLAYLLELLGVLQNEGVGVLVFEPYWRAMGHFGDLPKGISTFANKQDLSVGRIDFMITLGGDGTILEAATLIRRLPIPILGINMGRLGFLASIGPTRMKEAVLALRNGAYHLSARKLIHLESSLPMFENAPFAVNDFTVLKRDTSSMITINTFLNGDFLNTYWADGIIVATPTGSTGYSLSCGGPIIFPESDAFVITPVAPHNLNVRPLVVPDSSVISFEIEGRSDSFLCTLDSRFESITHEHQLAIRLADFRVQLVQLYGENFQKTIREKLNWGRDVRN